MNDCRVHCRTNLEVIRLLEPLYLKGGHTMSTTSNKRRGLCALLITIAAFGLAIIGAGSASAADLVTASVTGCVKAGKGEVAITNPTPDEARVEINGSLVATLAGGQSKTVEVSVPGSMTLSWNGQGKGN